MRRVRNNPSVSIGEMPMTASAKILNMLPGPTFVPDRVMRSMLDSTIYHRSKEFHQLYRELQHDLQYVFRTKREVFVVSSSGTGGLESVVSNIIKPGDKVLAIVNGYFSQELCSIVEAFKGKAIRLDFAWNSGISLPVVEEALARDPEISAVGVAYVETSTGGRAPLRELAELCNKHGKLLFVDAESAVGGEEFRMDDWRIGAVVAGTQKCICSPPGLAMVTVGEDAWRLIEKNGKTGFYFDLHRYKDYAERSETPFTPALPQLFALRASLKLIKEEGLDAYINRQKECAVSLRDGLAALNLQPFVPKEYVSNVATAFDISRTHQSSRDIVKKMREVRGISIAGGMGPTKDTVIRIGTMGTVQPHDVRLTIDAIREVLR